MNKLSLSKFDLGMIIAFVVIGLLGGGAWWYLSGELATAQGDVGSAKTDFDRDSVKDGIVVSRPNQKIIQDNIDQLKAQLDPLIQNKLVPKESKLATIGQQDPVSWKHDLDNEVKKLTASAKLHAVKVPDKFYFAFDRYVGQNPGDEQTVVLSKQLLAISLMTNMLINAPVKAIQGVRRTYEEDGRSNNQGTPTTPGQGGQLSGSSTVVADTYTDYPFEFDFDATTDGLRKFMDDLMASPYIFVVRSVSVQNTQMTSPQQATLDQIVGTSNNASVVGSSPGEVAATTATLGPQFLFGNSPLHIKMRIDLIEWKAPAPSTPSK